MTTTLLPGGEILDLNAASLERIADAFEEISDAEKDLRSVKREVQDAIITRLDHEGRRQISVDGFKISATAPTEKEWDLPALQKLVRQLVGEGTISEHKADACLKWTPSVVWAEVKTLLSDPRCAERMKLTFTEVPANRYAKVQRG